jgi:hypothetical protein
MVSKRNALGLTFGSFSALEQHLAAWMLDTDRRVHETTYEAPVDRFVRDERTARGRYPRGYGRAVGSDSAAVWRTMRSSTSGTVRYTVPFDWCASRLRSPSRRTRSASFTA